MADKHAVLGASSADRWLNCPPSVMLTEGMPDTAGEAAAEGTLAHSIGELKLRKHYTLMGPRQFNAALKKLQADPLYTKEMDRATDEYFDTVKEIALGFSVLPYVALEQRVDFSQWVPEGFGTADCIVIGDEVLHVIDFKYGKGVQVDAEDNPQMRLYAIGAYQRYFLTHVIRRVRMSIFQPRNGGLSHAEEILVGDLLKWAEDFVAPRAALAAEGKGDFAPGDWCQFCKAKATCRARSDHNLALEGFQKALPPLLTDAEVGDALRRAQDLAKWAKALEDYALSACLAGKEIPGCKAVNGRSNAAFSPDFDTCAKILIEAGHDRPLLYREVPETLTNIDTVVGGRKKLKELLGSHLINPPGKPTLVLKTDKRPAITDRPTAEVDFGDTPDGPSMADMNPQS